MGKVPSEEEKSELGVVVSEGQGALAFAEGGVGRKC